MYPCPLKTNPMCALPGLVELAKLCGTTGLARVRLEHHTTIGRKWVAEFFLLVFRPRSGLPLALRLTNIWRFLFRHSAEAYVL